MTGNPHDGEPPKPDLRDLLHGRAADWLIKAAMRELAQRDRNGLPWPPFAREVVDELSMLAELPALALVSDNGHPPGTLEPDPGWVSTAEAAREVGLSPRSVGRYVSAGLVRGRRFGRNWFVDLQSLQSVLARRAS